VSGWSRRRCHEAHRCAADLSRPCGRSGDIARRTTVHDRRPEPVEHRHWELYLASQHFRDRDGWSGTAPHFEINYGVIPDVQLHVIAPLAYSGPSADAAHFGYGDTELGVKLRFVREGKWLPRVGTFPFLEVPSGNRRDPWVIG
jgi:hypothetical protein